MQKVRVLVADDSLTVRKHLLAVLATDPEIEIVGEAEDGKRAIELCRACRPDVVTMDMMMPVMTGLAATEYIMAHCPTPILIVSASINRGELFRTYEALAAGAVDVLDELVSLDRARNKYGVVFTGSVEEYDLAVDWDATAALRKEVSRSASLRE